MKCYFTVFCLMFYTSFIVSQTDYIALSSNDKIENTGTIINIKNNIPTTLFEFYDNGSNISEIVYLEDKIYGTTSKNGKNKSGTFFEYNIITNEFKIIFHFDKASGGNRMFFNNLIVANNKIYGIQTGLFSGPLLAEYNPSTNTVQQLYSLRNIGVNDVSDIVYNNNKIYGLNSHTPAGNSNFLFSVDLNDNSGSIVHTFIQSTGNTSYSLLAHTNGNIYGTTRYGGVNGKGTIYKYDTNNNVYSKLADLTTITNNLTQGNENKLYGYTNNRIYDFDLTTNSLNVIHTIQDNIPNGSFLKYTPLIYVDNTLMTITNVANGTTGKSLISYNINQNSYNSIAVSEQSTKIISTDSNRLFFGSVNNFKENLIEYKVSEQSFSSMTNLKLGTNGTKPIKIIKTGENEFYGLCNSRDMFNFNYGKVLFKYDKSTKRYDLLIDFRDYYNQNYGINHDIIKTSNNEVYILTIFSDSTPGFGSGQLLRYDVDTNTISKVGNFPNSNVKSIIGESKLYEFNKKLYFVALNNNDVKSIFSYNPLTSEIQTVLEDFGRILVNSNGYIYGIKNTGGTNGRGFVYKYDLISKQNIIIKNLSEEIIPYNSTENYNGDIYFTERTNTNNSSEGRIYKIDKQTNELSVFYEFNHSSLQTGRFPTMVYAAGSSIYVFTEGPGPGSTGPTTKNSYILRFKEGSINPDIVFKENGFNPPLSEVLLYKLSDETLVSDSLSPYYVKRHFSIKNEYNYVKDIFSYSNNFKNLYSLVDLVESTNYRTMRDELKIIGDSRSSSVNILENDDFIPSATTTIVNTGSGTAKGIVNINNLTGILTYTPTLSESDVKNPVTIEYKVCSGSICKTELITVVFLIDTDNDGIPNDTDTDDDNDGNPDSSDPNPLVASTTPDNFEIIGSSNNTINVLGNDDFVPGGSTTLVNAGTGTAKGMINFNATTGELTYTPTESELEAEESVTVDYTVCSGLTPNVCATETVTIKMLKDSDNDGIPDTTDTDDDNDGVNDNLDQCPNTPVGGLVDANGCALSQIDSDNDGITDDADICPNTPSGETVDANGCSTSQLDTDNDGIKDNVDICPNTPSGASVNSNGCSSSQLDSDNDGVMDNIDQCANTPSGSNVNAIGCIVFESKLTAKQTGPKCPGGKGFITLAVDSGSVTANVTVSGGTSLNVNDVSITTAGYTIDNLNPNDYVVTVSIPSQQFVQEFGLTVSDAQAVAAKRTTTNTASRSATYVVSGSPNYKVTVNGNTFSVHVGTVNQTSIYLDGLQAGNNTITIKGDSDCQGKVTDIIDLELGVKIYPNPCTDFIYMDLAYNYDVTIYDTMGNVIVRRKVLADKMSRFDMSSLKSGVYLVQFVGKNTQFIKKIIKK